jgi:glycosyltransferase involved in cell wall biosynthesis
LDTTVTGTPARLIRRVPQPTPTERRLRIAQVAPPIESVPPSGYGGTERVVYELVCQLVERGHDVTTFASGDSDVPGRRIETVPEALRPAGSADHSPWVLRTLSLAADHAAEFDVIHSHLEWSGLLLPRMTRTPVVATFHGRLDFPWARELLGDADAHLVAISENHAGTHAELDWTVIHNGLTLDDKPSGGRRDDALCFVGRVAPEKGIVEAIEVAQLAGRPLRIAAKVGVTPAEVDYDEQVFRPALKAAGRSVEYLGELDEAERDELFATSDATVMPGSWPEPFGLVAIESLACGTPVLARRVGALPEIIRDGIDGYFGDDARQLAFRVDDVAGLDRDAIRESVVDRFSSSRMADAYEDLYRRIMAGTDDTTAVGSSAEPASIPGIAS